MSVVIKNEVIVKEEEEESATFSKKRNEKEKHEYEQRQLQNMELKRKAMMLKDCLNKKQKKENLMTKVDNALKFAKKAYEELLDIKKFLIESNYKEQSHQYENMENSALLEDQSSEDEMQHISNSSQNEFDYINYFAFCEVEGGRSPSSDVFLKEDKILPEDLWMMQNKAENFDNKMIIELVKNSGVFINKLNLKRILSRAQSQNVLARGIMCELFTPEALRKSSLDGKASDTEDKKRPRLPTIAVEVMLQFVRSHAQTYNWKLTSDINIRNSLRDKLKELRRKIRQAN